MDFQYCIIKSKLTSVVLDVKQASKDAGAPVLTWERHDKENQIFYQDPTTGTIRSKMNDYCFDLDDDKLILNPYQVGDKNQQWEFHGDLIRNKVTESLVLDIFGMNIFKGATVGSYTFNGGANQRWEFELVGGEAPHIKPPPPRRYFYIVSELNEKVLDIERGLSEVGARLVVWRKGNEVVDNQLWYFDENGFIRSKLNNMVFSNEEHGRKLLMAEYTDSKRYQWKFLDKQVCNGAEECLDIKDRKSDDGAKVISYRYKDQKNQHWSLEYLE